MCEPHSGERRHPYFPLSVARGFAAHRSSPQSCSSSTLHSPGAAAGPSASASASIGRPPRRHQRQHQHRLAPARYQHHVPRATRQHQRRDGQPRAVPAARCRPSRPPPFSARRRLDKDNSGELKRVDIQREIDMMEARTARPPPPRGTPAARARAHAHTDSVMALQLCSPQCPTGRLVVGRVIHIHTDCRAWLSTERGRDQLRHNRGGNYELQHCLGLATRCWRRRRRRCWRGC